MTEAAAETTVKKQKRKMRDAYIARLTISIPLDMADPDCLKKAVEAVGKIEAGMPAGAVVDVAANIGKLPDAGLT